MWTVWAGAQTPAPLTELNNAFRAAYVEARTRVVAQAGPVLVVSGDNFALLSGGKRTEANVAVPVYDPVKTMAHIPLAIFVMLTPGEGAIAEARLATLTKLRGLIAPAEASLSAVPLPEGSRARQKRIAEESAAYLDELAAKKSFTRAGLSAFTRRMAPLVMENVGEATRAQLDATHAQVSKWRKELSAEEWGKLRVVIIGPHMPREELVVTQYFLRVLGEKREGGRVVYAESLWQEPQAMELLGTHLLDGDVGEAFFGEAMRMHRDLLADAAKRYLPGLVKR
jgi:hypothetical protein